MSAVQTEAVPVPKPAPQRLQLGRMKKELTMLLVMVALAIITSILNPSFLSGDNLRNTLRHISLISLFALGEAVVIIAGGIDLSIGSVICIAAVLTSSLTMFQGLDIGTAVVLAMIGSIVIGFAQGWVSAFLGVQPFVVTLGSMLLLRGVAEVITGGGRRFSGIRATVHRSPPAHGSG